MDTAKPRKDGVVATCTRQHLAKHVVFSLWTPPGTPPRQTTPPDEPAPPEAAPLPAPALAPRPPLLIDTSLLTAPMHHAEHHAEREPEGSPLGIDLIEEITNA